MSYEGYRQIICANGHLYERDRHDTSVCSCGTLAAWSNSVDQTNGPDVGAIPQEEFDRVCLVTPAIAETCGHCGAFRVTAKAVYRPPTLEETQAMRRVVKWG